MKKMLLFGLMLLISAYVNTTSLFAQEPPPPPPVDDDKEIVGEAGEMDAKYADDDDRGHHWRKGMREKGERGSAMMQEMEKYEPDIKKLFKELSNYDVKKAKVMRDIFEDMPMIHKMAKNNEDMKKLIATTTKTEIETVILSMKIQKGDKNQANIDQLKKQLKEKLSASFDNKQRLRQERLDYLKKVIMETEQELKYRTENKSKIIDKRFDELTDPLTKNTKW